MKVVCCGPCKGLIFDDRNPDTAGLVSHSLCPPCVAVLYPGREFALLRSEPRPAEPADAEKVQE